MTDEELLAAWRGGDEAAGERLLAGHFETIRRFFVNKVRDDPEALIQDTFLECVRSRDKFAGRTPFKYYLLGIARNLLRQYWRGQSVRGPTVDVDVSSIAALGAGPSTIIGQNRDEKRLLDALRGIGLADQEILELYYWESMTGSELGQVLGISESGARSRLHRARLALCEEYRRQERSAGIPESSDGSIEGWATKVREGLSSRKPRKK